MCKFVLSASAFALAAAVAAGAAAETGVSRVTLQAQPQPDVEIKSAVVEYRDLNLDTSSGVRALYARIRHAAERVCAPAPYSIKDIPDNRDYDQCRNRAIQGALAQVNSPALSSLYAR